MGLLLVVLKATMNVLHKLASVLGAMLSSEPDDRAQDLLMVLDWPEEQKENSALERSEWTHKQLCDLEVSCEHLLTEGTWGFFFCFFFWCPCCIT